MWQYDATQLRFCLDRLLDLRAAAFVAGRLNDTEAVLVTVVLNLDAKARALEGRVEQLERQLKERPT